MNTVHRVSEPHTTPVHRKKMEKHDVRRVSTVPDRWDHWCGSSICTSMPPRCTVSSSLSDSSAKGIRTRTNAKAVDHHAAGQWAGCFCEQLPSASGAAGGMGALSVDGGMCEDEKGGNGEGAEGEEGRERRASAAFLHPQECKDGEKKNRGGAHRIGTLERKPPNPHAPGPISFPSFTHELPTLRPPPACVAIQVAVAKEDNGTLSGQSVGMRRTGAAAGHSEIGEQGSFVEATVEDGKGKERGTHSLPSVGFVGP
ncbi:hypothetical protein B0H14DRAFT_2599118 [Mycena olivaceomarginata]|nr:hypothetical protein B0H14DRAFT_2599118 [Mycena olivaceomarginata]